LGVACADKASADSEISGSPAAWRFVRRFPRRVESVFDNEVSTSLIIILHILFGFPQRHLQLRYFGIAP
jgi:hypothetical protein